MVLDKKNTFTFAFKQSLPVMTGYIVLGIGFGILLQSKGYGVLWAMIMSITIYAGSMQYVAIDLLAGGASLITTAVMTLMVNLRHLFYGVAMVDKYRNVGKAKPYLIFALTDETFSLVCSPEIHNKVDEKGYYFYVSLLDQIYWVTGSVMGNLLGNIFPFSTDGIDFSMTALFFVIVLGQWESEKEHKPALIGLCTTAACLFIFGSSDFLIPSMVIITVLLFAAKRFIKS